MLRSLFGGKKRSAQSVNDVRKGRPRRPVEPADNLEARIKARRAHNLKMANVKAGLESAGPVERPDISGAVEAAKCLIQESDTSTRQEAIARALRLKGSADIIDETLNHPARRYLALAILRGLLEQDHGHDGGRPGKAVKMKENSNKKSGTWRPND